MRKVFTGRSRTAVAQQAEIWWQQQTGFHRRLKWFISVGEDDPSSNVCAQWSLYVYFERQP